MSKQKTLLLGENFSTASHKLRKMILFSLVQKLELDNCHRCTLKIEKIEHFSIEHIEAWQSATDPIESFYSLDNIAFSHLNCNIAAASKPLQKYGTRKEYRAANWARYYAKNKEQVLKKKRDRYRNSRN